MSRKLRTISALLLLLWLPAIAEAPISPDQFRRMVRSELESLGRKSDSVWVPLTVRGVGVAESDFLLAPVTRAGELVSLFRYDPRRSWVKEFDSEVIVNSVRRELLNPAGASKFLKERKLGAETPTLVSVGPLSLFGSVGVGWYVPAAESFFLLSLSGKTVTKEEVQKLWPQKAAILELLAKEAKQPDQSGQGSAAGAGF